MFSKPLNPETPSWLQDSPSSPTNEAHSPSPSPSPSSWGEKILPVIAKIAAVALMIIELVAITLTCFLCPIGPATLGTLYGATAAVVALIPLGIKYQMFCFTGDDFADIGHFMLCQTAINVSFVIGGALLFQGLAGVVFVGL